MNQPNKIPVPFANSGDKNTIPDVATEQGQASWSEGFPQITQVPVSQGGVAPTREDFNGIFNALSAHVAFAQTGDTYEWDNSTDYAVGARVKGSDGNLYEAVAVSGPSESVGAVSPVTEGQDVWVVANANSYLPLSGGTMTGRIINTSANLPYRHTNEYDTVDMGISLNGNVGIYGASGWYFLANRERGETVVTARTTTGGYQLKLLADGTATWANKTIECSVEKGNGYLKLSDGTQICWGATQVATQNNDVTVTYARAFSGTPSVSFVCYDTTVRLKTWGNTTFTVAKGSSTNPWLSYVVVGVGA